MYISKENYPVRKKLRLEGYNYSEPGAYFITVCVKDRKELLGRIEFDNRDKKPKMILSFQGKTLNEQIIRYSEKYSNIKIEKYVIMPNHFHMIVRVIENINKNHNSENNEISKLISTIKRSCNRIFEGNIWQKSFNDHIIRGEKDYCNIWEYISTNVLRWESDVLNIP